MGRRKKTRTVALVGRRWFDKINGNTYCSTEIVVNGALLVKVGPVCGYGDYWVQQGTEWLDHHKYLPGLAHHDNGSYEPIWAYAPRMGIALFRTVSDVNRKGDL